MGLRDNYVIPDWSVVPNSYRDVLVAIVGDRDPVEVLEETTSRILALIAGRSDEEVRSRPSQGEWSAGEIVGHLLDDEIIFAFRMRLGLTGVRPTYAGTEPDRWLQLAKPPFTEALETFRSLRSYNLRTIRALDPAGWQRAGVHDEQGEETVEMTVLKTAGHDLIHLDQLERALPT